MSDDTPLWSEGTPRRPDEFTGTRELKVRIPVQLHVRLHAHKLLDGQTISATVEEALRGYFEAKRAARGGELPRLPGEPAYLGP